MRGVEPPAQEARERTYVALVEQVHVLGLQYAQTPKHTCKALAKRLLCIMGSTNHQAHRTIPPLHPLLRASGGVQTKIYGSYTYCLSSTLSISAKNCCALVCDKAASDGDVASIVACHLLNGRQIKGNDFTEDLIDSSIYRIGMRNERF